MIEKGGARHQANTAPHRICGGNGMGGQFPSIGKEKALTHERRNNRGGAEEDRLAVQQGLKRKNFFGVRSAEVKERETHH